MSIFRSSVARLVGVAGCLGLAKASADVGPFSLIAGSEQLTAVSARVFGGYLRVRNPDGSYRSEHYVFGNGGMVTTEPGAVDAVGIARGGTGGGVVSDPTIDRVGFGALARTLARPLAEQNYLGARDPAATDLLVMVYWGRSQGSYSYTDGNSKDYTDAWNAQLMGFNAERFIRDRTNYSTVFWGRDFRSMMMDNVHYDVISALQMDRYYVILRAFDFQAAWRHRRIKLLWETRFSLSERQHDFGEELPTMAHTASKYFGQDTHGLVRARIPEGEVDIGDVKSLGNVPAK